jgi:hypothetical protein
LCSALLASALTAFLPACAPEDAPLAPYAGGGRDITTVTVEELVFSPRVTWLGGFVSVLGVNRGDRAALDSTLVWLVRSGGNTLRYPVTYGVLPQGAQDMTALYGGTTSPLLEEDNTYTFWVMKDDAWSQTAALRNTTLCVDSSGGAPVRIQQDTVFVRQESFMSVSRRLDVYINIREVRAFGRLGILSVLDSDSTSTPVVTFRITQAGLTDTAVSAIGVVDGTLYDVTKVVWEMISREVLPDTTIYWKNNVIRSPVWMGETVPGTVTFVSFPAEGLQRGHSYYLWIANSGWDQVNRGRATPGYAYATFVVW